MVICDFQRLILAGHCEDHQQGLPYLLILKTFHPGESVLALGFLSTADSPSRRARLWRE